MDFRFLLLAAAAAVCLLPGCASSPPAGGVPSLKSRQTAAWRRDAQVVKAGRFTVWYHGYAEPGPTAHPGHWNGTVRGDIFAKSPRGYLVIPEGSLTIDAANRLVITGVHRTVVF